MLHRCMIKSAVVWLRISVVSLLMCVCGMSHCSGVDLSRTVRHTHINKGKSSQFRYDLIWKLC